MKYKIIIPVLIMVVLISGCTENRVSNKRNEEVMKSTAKSAVWNLNNGDYQSFYNRLTTKMKNSVNKTWFENMRTIVLESSGEFLGRMQQEDIGVVYGDVTVYNAGFEKGNVTVKVTFNENGKKIEGIWFVSGRINSQIQKKRANN